jgi:NADPH:quinone reductase-like Zn-dependent oxidoreductase
LKAIVYTEYGSPDVLRYVDVPKPGPNDHEVLVRVRAAALNALDWRMRRGRPYVMRLMIGGLHKPKTTRPGVDFAGEVEAVGRYIKQFKPGDAVFGASEGACAEYVCISESKLAQKPANVSFDEAAALPVAALTALQGLRDHGRIQSGHKVAIDGASGGVGTYGIQVAKSFGAEVTAVCSPRQIDIARSLGADRVIDYTREDFTQSSERYDVILAANAYHSIFDYRRVLAANGSYVMAGGGWPQMFQMMALASLLSRLGRKKCRFFIAKVTQSDLALLGDLLATGKMVSVIDRRYPLSETREAVRYLEEGHAKGKIIITVGGPL